MLLSYWAVILDMPSRCILKAEGFRIKSCEKDANHFGRISLYSGLEDEGPYLLDHNSTIASIARRTGHNISDIVLEPDEGTIISKALNRFWIVKGYHWNFHV